MISQGHCDISRHRTAPDCPLRILASLRPRRAEAAPPGRPSPPPALASEPGRASRTSARRSSLSRSEHALSTRSPRFRTRQAGPKRQRRFVPDWFREPARNVPNLRASNFDHRACRPPKYHRFAGIQSTTHQQQSRLPRRRSRVRVPSAALRKPSKSEGFSVGGGFFCGRTTRTGA